MGVELRTARRAGITRRLRAPDRPPDRLSIPAGVPCDRLDREALHEVHAADLRPLLHSNQLLLLASAWLTEPGSHPRQGGPFFNRPRVGSIQAASTTAWVALGGRPSRL